MDAVIISVVFVCIWLDLSTAISMRNVFPFHGWNDFSNPQKSPEGLCLPWGVRLLLPSLRQLWGALPSLRLL
jgi:hypothetical protein